MATNKETTKKKDTATKKKAAPKKKAAEKKVTKPVEKVEPIVNEEAFEPIVNEDTFETKEYKEIAEDTIKPTPFSKENLEVMNGDPTVVTPKEEEPKKEEKVAEKKENKIIKKINRAFGYLWNGQAIDF